MESKKNLGVINDHSTDYMNQITEEKKKVLKGINSKIQRLTVKARARLTALTLIIVLGFGLVGCNKDFNDSSAPPQQGELITQTFNVTTVINEKPILKSFNPDEWTYRYSDTKYELKFSNAYNTYTKTVSINEIIQGVTFQMYAGTYTVSYNPVQNPLYSDVLNVSINGNVQVNGTPITLKGELEDALIIVDIPKNLLYPYPNAIMDSRGTGFPTLLYDSQNDIYYGYTNIRPEHPLTIYFADNSYGTVDIPNFQKGVVYWFAKEQGSTTQLQIPALTVQRIPL